jgi:hypothetical protein
MSVCDFGICNRGEALFECYAMHLPVLANDNLSRSDGYRCLYLDSFSTELNKFACGEIIPELVAMNFPSKVAELWGEWMINPKLKFKLMDTAYEEILKFLPYTGASDMFEENRINYLATRKPDDILVENVMSLLENYQGIAESYREGLSYANSKNLRLSFLES